MATQLGSKIGPWADIFSQKASKGRVVRIPVEVPGPTWRPEAAQDAPKRPQGSIFNVIYRFLIDLGGISNGFLMILDIILCEFRH